MEAFRLLPALTDLGEVPTENSSEARLVMSADGWWVYKARSKIGADGVLAEGVCWMLARIAELPVPDAAHGVLTDWGLGWLSYYVPFASAFELDPAIANVEEIGGVLALDALVGNEDRHADNLLLEVGGDTRFRVRPIDWDRAAVSRPDRMRTKYSLAGVLDTTAVVPGLPLDRLRPRADDVARRLGALRQDQVIEIFKTANEHLDLDDRVLAEGAVLLCARLAVAPRIVEQYWEQLTRNAP